MNKSGLAQAGGARGHCRARDAAPGVHRGRRDGQTNSVMDTRASGRPKRREEGRRVVSLAEGRFVETDWTWFGTWAPERKQRWESCGYRPETSAGTHGGIGQD